MERQCLHRPSYVHRRFHSDRNDCHQILQDDLRNMGLIFEDVPASTRTAPIENCGDQAIPLQRVVHGDRAHCETLDQRKKPETKLPTSKEYQNGRRMAGVPKRTAEGSSRQVSNMKGVRSRENRSHCSDPIRHRVRPKSAGPVQVRPQSSRPRSPGSPLPRVAFLANSKCQLGGDPPRQHFPLVGGLQSELDNNEAYLILGDTLKRTGCIDAGHERDVYARQVAWMTRVHAKAEQKRQELHEEEISKCTFRPATATQPQTPQVCLVGYPDLSQFMMHMSWRIEGQCHSITYSGVPEFGNAAREQMCLASFVGCKATAAWQR